MPSYVMVSADFPGVTSDQRTKIYENLKSEKWVKVTEVGRDISTVWYASFEDTVSLESAINISKNDFINSSKLYTIPKLVIHAGPNKPTFTNLT